MILRNFKLHKKTSQSVLHNFKGFQEKPRRKIGATSTEERREKHKERMREIWRGRKKEGRKQLKQT